MPRILKVAAAIALLLFIMSSWALVRLAQARATQTDRSPGTAESGVGALNTDNPARSLVIPEFSLTDQNDRPFTREDLRGAITVVGFVFTHCPLVCPTLMEKMRGLSVALKDEPVRFLSISVDPVHDTPEALRAFAALHGADTARWTFLTGDKAEVDRIVTDGLMFAIMPDPGTPLQLADGSRMDNIIHPSWFVLLGPDAEVLSLYKPSDSMNMQVLLDDVRRLARERSSP